MMKWVYTLTVLYVIFFNGFAEKIRDGKVLTIDKDHFQETVDAHDFVLVYIIEIGHPLETMADSNGNKMASDLAPTRYDVVVLKCNWDDTPTFWKTYGVNEPPGTLFFIKGQIQEFYSGPPIYEQFLKWVLVNLRKNSPKKQELTTIEPTTIEQTTIEPTTVTED